MNFVTKKILIYLSANILYFLAVLFIVQDNKLSSMDRGGIVIFWIVANLIAFLITVGVEDSSS